MKKRRVLYILLVLLVTIVAFILYYSNISCYKPAEKMSGLSVVHHDDDTIRIAYIGDSWAYRHQEMPGVIDSIVSVSMGRPVVVRNAGVGGLVSKEIYYSLFYNHVFKDVIEWGPDFCFVSAGINDTNKKSGQSNFRENMRLIISLLLDNGITPVVMEIPHYDIWYTFNQMEPITMFRSVRSMMWTFSSVDCIDDYTDSLNKLIDEQQWQDAVIVVRRDCWNSQGYQGQKDIYTTDRMHINPRGYYVLDSCIASGIVSFLRKNENRNQQ
jgi:lysophospholipase L1-like esterase